MKARHITERIWLRAFGTTPKFPFGGLQICPNRYTQSAFRRIKNIFQASPSTIQSSFSPPSRLSSLLQNPHEPLRNRPLLHPPAIHQSHGKRHQNPHLPLLISTTFAGIAKHMFQKTSFL